MKFANIKVSVKIIEIFKNKKDNLSFLYACTKISKNERIIGNNAG